MTICLTNEEVAAAMETEEEDAEGEMARFLEDRLCCFGRVGGGWFGECPVEKLCCFLNGPCSVAGSVGDTGDRAMGREEGPEGLRAVCGGNPPVKVLGGAGGGALGDAGRRTCREVGGESSAGGGGGGGEASSGAAGLKSYTMLGNFCARNCWRPALES